MSHSNSIRRVDHELQFLNTMHPAERLAIWWVLGEQLETECCRPSLFNPDQRRLLEEAHAHIFWSMQSNSLGSVWPDSMFTATKKTEAQS